MSDNEPNVLDTLLRDLDEEDRLEAPPRRIERVVMAGWARRDVGVHQMTRPVERQARRLVPRLAVGIPAGLALAATLLLLLNSSGPAVAPPIHVATDGAGPAARNPRPEASSTPESLARLPARVAEPGVGSRPVASQAAPATSLELAAATDEGRFVGLLPVAEQEVRTLRLMRVRLRSDAVGRLGLDSRMPVSAADGFVQADVLLGDDGTARAIRFVP